MDITRREFIERTAVAAAVAALPIPVTGGEEEPVFYSVPVLQCDVPNKNGRIYPREVIEKCCEQFNQGWPLPVQNGFSQDSRVSFDRLLFTSDLIHVGPEGWVRISVKAEDMKKIPEGYVVRTAGVGSLEFDEEKNAFVIGEDFKLIYCAICPKSNAS